MLNRSLHVFLITHALTLFVFLLFSQFSYVSAEGIRGHEDVNDVIVKVDGDPVTRGDILRRIQVNKGDIDPSKMERGKWQGMMQTATKSEIIDKLLFKAAHSENMKIEPEKLETFIDQKMKSLGKEKFQEILGIKNTATEQEFKEFVKEKMLIEKYRARLVKDITIENKEVKEYYEEKKDTLSRPDRVHVELLVMDKAVDADALFKRIKKGEDFEKAARENGKNETSSIEIRFSWTTYDAMPTSIRQQLKDGKKSDILEPFLSNDKYYIVKILEKRPAGTAGLDEIEDRIREVLRRKKETTTILSWYEARVRDHKIEYVKK